MFEISVTNTYDHDRDPASDPETVVRTVLKEHHATFRNIFKQCIDDSVILNAVKHELTDVDDVSVTKYYSVTQDQATEFVRRFRDTSQLLCLENVWNSANGQITFEVNEIDFNTVYDVLELVNDDPNYCWGYYTYQY